MSFNIALTGLNAAAADLNVTSNNIANTGTLGFKSSRAEFADIFATSQFGISSNAVGQGTKLSNVRQQFTQGQFDFTGNSLDLAVSGTGFFNLRDTSGNNIFSRAGAFELDRQGFVVNPSGARLQGLVANATGELGGMGDLRVDTGDIDPSATSLIDITANLNANQSEPAEAFDASDASSYNFSTSTTVYNSQGNSERATLYFRRTEDANIWDIHVVVGDDEANEGSVQAQFNQNGRLELIGGGTNLTSGFTFGAGGGAAQPTEFDVDFSGLTQFGTPFSVAALTQDGYTSGQFSSLDVAGNGTIFGRFTNGQSRVLGEVQLARFPNPEKLTQLGDNSWAESFESGEPILGRPETSGLGNLQAGALEQSNVDITAQLVKMITAQRNFQANAKMISTQDQVTQEIINIR